MSEPTTLGWRDLVLTQYGDHTSLIWLTWKDDGSTVPGFHDVAALREFCEFVLEHTRPEVAQTDVGEVIEAGEVFEAVVGFRGELVVVETTDHDGFMGPAARAAGCDVFVITLHGDDQLDREVVEVSRAEAREIIQGLAALL